MKKRNVLRRMLCAAFACIFLLSFLSLTVCAADNPAPGETPTDAPNPPDDASQNTDATEYPNEDPDATEYPDDDPDAGNVTPTEPPEDDDDDYWGTLPDVTSPYVEPTYLDELPAVKDADVVVATAIPVPQAVVSDASLFSGIVMWICVAVGIAVVVGVMVSKRTRRRS